MALSQLGDEMLNAAKGKKQKEALRAVAFAYHDYAKLIPNIIPIYGRKKNDNVLFSIFS